MEIGSFIELQFTSGTEYYGQDNGIIRLNTGRAAIWHASRVLDCDTIWIPYYQCDTVREFLKRKNVTIKYYHIDKNFDPIDLCPNRKEAVLVVNYYGVMSMSRMNYLENKYNNVIIDNSQAFFCKPLDNCMNVYSCRKFIGVPDGAYLIGNNADNYINEYQQGYSSDTALFLLQRIEYGCEGKVYASRQINEQRIDTEDCLKMSILSRKILCSTDYKIIRQKRIENFEIACRLFDDINCLKPKQYFDNTCVPMVYPLVVEDDKLLKKLLENKHFQGHWWSYLLEEVEKESFEFWISKYVIPITIDQRYGERELQFLYSMVCSDKL